MEAFKYQPIDLTSSAFRLVRLLRASKYKETIQCQIIHTTLDDNVISYEAVSYTWGTNAKPSSIILDGRAFMVTSNLWTLLHNLRQTEKDRYLWIDAICINQDNKSERGHQVRRMRTIYEGADCVLVYLGEATHDIDTFIDSLAALQTEAEGHRWEPNDVMWESTWENAQLKLRACYGDDVVNTQQRRLRELLERPWFRRVWILQEVASARRALLCCGEKSVSIRIFALSPMLLRIDLDRHTTAVFDLMPTYSTTHLPETRGKNLLQLLIDFRDSKASDPHDNIFALLGLCADQDIWKCIEPDYNQSESDLVRATVTYITTRDPNSPPEWISSVTDSSIGWFLSCLVPYAGYSSPQYITKVYGHILGSRDVEAIQALLQRGTTRYTMRPMLNAAASNTRDAREMFSLLLREWSGLNNDIPEKGVSSFYIYFLFKLEAILRVPASSYANAMMPAEQKSLYHLFSFAGGSYVYRDDDIFYAYGLYDPGYRQHARDGDLTPDEALARDYHRARQDAYERLGQIGSELSGLTFDTISAADANRLETKVANALFDLDGHASGELKKWALFMMALTNKKSWLVKTPPQVEAANGYDAQRTSDAMALYVAMYYRAEVATRFLLEQGVKIVIGRLPNSLTQVLNRQARPIMNLLRTHRANIVGYDDRMASHCAIEVETIPVIRFLFELGNDFDATDKDGRTAIQVARDNGRSDVLLFLEGVRDGKSYSRGGEDRSCTGSKTSMCPRSNHLE